MRAALFALAIMLTATNAQACHRYQTWRYPFPQRCGGMVRLHFSKATASLAPLPRSSVSYLKPEVIKDKLIFVPPTEIIVIPGPTEEQIGIEGLKKQLNH